MILRLTFTDDDSTQVIVQNGQQEVQVFPFQLGQLNLIIRARCGIGDSGEHSLQEGGE